MRIIKKPTEKNMKFKEVEVREPLVRDAISAEKLCGTSQGVGFLAALISVSCKFDGQYRQYEDVISMRASDFLELSGALGFDAELMQKESLPSKEKESSDTEK